MPTRLSCQQVDMSCWHAEVLTNYWMIYIQSCAVMRVDLFTYVYMYVCVTLCNMNTSVYVKVAERKDRRMK